MWDSPVYWEILDLTGTHPETKQLFSTEDWTEMLKSFKDEIETIEEVIPDVVYLFFDEIEQIIKNNEKSEDIVTEIDRISSQKIEAKHKITLGEQNKAYMIEIKKAVLTYWTHQIFAMDCKGTNICRYGKLCTTDLHNFIRTLACLEKFYIDMKNVKLPSTPYAIKQMTLLYPMLEHIEKSEKKRTEKNMPMLSTWFSFIS
ncbi:hypothetical protein RhiirC2_721522 [Rhizophagus irregularis]|uniref:Uncharacterized protein n=1 Tax=Rhizophagus irregularis TaxID=588596 RepID=A0A2N1M5Q3_9GLOM|nr:hypothetical protein RhiirC2_721522 [Rhizophagus irregularis]